MEHSVTAELLHEMDRRGIRFEMVDDSTIRYLVPPEENNDAVRSCVELLKSFIVDQYRTNGYIPLEYYPIDPSLD